MSPEQASGKARELDGRTDVWSAGATFFTLVSGQYVHTGVETALQLLIAAGTSAPRSLATVAPQMPPAIVAIMDRALAFRAEDRWPTAGAMRDALATAARSYLGLTSPEAVVAGAVRSHVALRVNPVRTVPMAPQVSAPPVPNAALTTVSPTSSDPAAAPALAESSVFFVSPAEPRLRRGVLLATAAAAVLTGLISAGAVLAVRASHRDPAAEPARATLSPGREDPIAASTQPAPQASQTSQPAPAALAPLAGEVDAGALEGTAAPARVAIPAPTPRPAVRPQATSTSPKAGCDPNWYIDSAGIKKYKAECL
jgi:serine/threonine-protein kinase